MKHVRVLAILLLVFAFSGEVTGAHGKLREFPLSEVVSRSTLILIGEVIKLEKTDERPVFARGENIYRATIIIEEVIKGNMNENRVIVDYFLHPEEPQFSMRKVFVFLFERHDRLRVFPGWYGLIPFGHERGYPDRPLLGPIHIPGEAKYQRPEEFITRVRHLLED